MQIEHFMRNADAAIKRLADQMEDFAGRNRLKYDYVAVASFQGSIDTLRSLGVIPNRVAELQEQIDEIGAEIRKEAA